jgi:hypothetical protein
VSRQPTQRQLFEGLRGQAETVRTTQIAAADRIASRTNDARAAARLAKAEADSALQRAQDANAAAAVAAAEAGNAAGAAATATDQASAASGAAAQANGAVATANAALTRLGRTSVATVSTIGDASPNGDGSWSNKLGLVLSGPAEGLLSVVRVAIPVAGHGGAAASAFSRRQSFELRLNGVPVCNRQVSTIDVQMMTFTFANPTPLPAGISTYELFYSGGSDGFVDDGDGSNAVRSMTVLLVAG